MMTCMIKTNVLDFFETLETSSIAHFFFFFGMIFFHEYFKIIYIFEILCFPLNGFYRTFDI